MSFQLPTEEGEFLVELARKAVERYLKNGTVIDVPENSPTNLLKQCGVFVTISSLRYGEKELRGCIGFPYPTMPLTKAVIEAAINATTQDPRFRPVSLGELSKIVFELSILTPPQLIEVEKTTEYPTKIKVGKDGLIVERGYHKGLLLPQVPIEWNWTEEEFLSQCCMKARLTPDSWLLEGTKIYKFSCIIAKEVAPKSGIIINDLRKTSNKNS